MPSLDRVDDVFVLDLGDTENRFHPDWLTSVEESLDVVEQAEGPRALVTTATGKFFSNGLDLEWLGAHGEEMADYIARVQALFAHVLELPVVTVTHPPLPGAAITGRLRHIERRDPAGDGWRVA